MFDDHFLYSHDLCDKPIDKAKRNKQTGDNVKMYIF